MKFFSKRIRVGLMWMKLHREKYEFWEKISVFLYELLRTYLTWLRTSFNTIYTVLFYVMYAMFVLKCLSIFTVIFIIRLLPVRAAKIRNDRFSVFSHDTLLIK